MDLEPLGGGLRDAGTLPEALGGLLGCGRDLLLGADARLLLVFFDLVFDSLLVANERRRHRVEPVEYRRGQMTLHGFEQRIDRFEHVELDEGGREHVHDLAVGAVVRALPADVLDDLDGQGVPEVLPGVALGRAGASVVLEHRLGQGGPGVAKDVLGDPLPGPIVFGVEGFDHAEIADALVEPAVFLATGNRAADDVVGGQQAARPDFGARGTGQRHSAGFPL